MNTRAAAIEALERRLGHRFTDRDLLERALTHASVGDGAVKVRHNERLEFLGDRVLGLVTAERLLALFPEAVEGELAPRLNALVSGKTCARVARKIDLGPALRMSGSASKLGARDSDGVLGDAIEALMAALYIDGGLETARAFFLDVWSEEFENLDGPRSKDAKTRLQEWAMRLGLPLPEYEVVGRTGPDHAPCFTVEVRVRGYESTRGEGSSRRDAEKAAALTMLLKQEGKA